MDIRVHETHEPRPGAKMAWIVAEGGDRFEVYPELLSRLQPGTSWTVDVTEREWQGRVIRRITKAAAIMAPVRDDERNGVVAVPPRARGGGAGSPAAPAGPTDETYFVVELLKMMIAHGHIKDLERDLGSATQLLRNVYRGNLGGAS